jgi:hypothetical protein
MESQHDRDQSPKGELEAIFDTTCGILIFFGISKKADVCHASVSLRSVVRPRCGKEAVCRVMVNIAWDVPSMASILEVLVSSCRPPTYTLFL